MSAGAQDIQIVDNCFLQDVDRGIDVLYMSAKYRIELGMDVVFVVDGVEFVFEVVLQEFVNQQKDLGAYNKQLRLLCILNRISIL